MHLYIQNRNRFTDIENKHGYQREKVGGGGRDKLGGWDYHIHSTCK